MFLIVCLIKTRKFKQSRQIMCIAVINELTIRKIMLFDLLGNSRLERTFHRVAYKVIRSRVKSIIKQASGFADAEVSQLLKVYAIHKRLCLPCPPSLAGPYQ